MAEAKEAKGEMIYKKIISIMKEVGTISKDQTNVGQGHFKYRGIDDVYNELHQHLSKNGVFSVPEVIDSRSEERESKKGGILIYRILTMQYTFFAEDGSSIVARVIGEGMDSGDKAANKAMAVAHKYALLQLFCIPTGDPKDPDAESHEVKPRGQGQAQQRQPQGQAKQQNGSKAKREMIPVQITRGGNKVTMDYYEALKLFPIAKEHIGKDAYYKILGNHAYEKANMIRKGDMDKIYNEMVQYFMDMKNAPAIEDAQEEAQQDPPAAEEAQEDPQEEEGKPAYDPNSKDFPF